MLGKFKKFKIIFLVFFFIQPVLYAGSLSELLEKNQYNNAKRYVENANISNIAKSEKYIKLGIYCLKNNNFNEAKKNFMTSALLNPNNYLAYSHLGRISFKEKSFSRAKHELSKAIELNADLIMANYYLGIIFNNEGNLIKAEEHLLRAHNLSPSNADIIIDLLNFYHKIHNFRQYIIYANKFLNMNTEDYEIKYSVVNNIITHYSNTANLNQLTNFYNNLPHNIKSDTGILIRTSKAFFDNNNMNKAKEILNEIVKDDSMITEKEYLLANIHYNEQNYLKSLEHFRNFLKHKPADTKTVYTLFDIYKNISDFSNFEKCFELILKNQELYSLNKETVYIGLEFLFSNQRYNFIPTIFDKLCDTFYKDEKIIDLKIQYYQSTFNIKSLVNFLLSNKSNIKSNELLNKYAGILLSTGNFEKLNILVAENPNIIIDKNELNKIKGYLYYIDQNYDSAIFHWKNYLDKFPKSKNINYYISTIHKINNNLNNERTFLQAEYQNNPYNYLNLKRSIDNSLSLGDIKRAEFHALVMLSIDTGLQHPRQFIFEKNIYSNESSLLQAINTTKNTVNLPYTKDYLKRIYSHALSQVKINNYSEGLKYLKQSLYITEDNLNKFYFYKGICYLNLHNYIYSYIYLTLSNFYGYNVPALYNLILLSNHLGYYETALSNIEKLYEIEPEARNNINITVLHANILYNKKNYPEALIKYMTLQKQGYKNAEYYIYQINYNLANKYYFEGNYPLALTYYRNCLDYEDNQGLIFFKLGNTNFRMNNFERAKIKYDKAIYYNFKNDKIYNNMALINLILKNNNEAERFFNLIGREYLNIENEIITNVKKALNENNYSLATQLIRQVNNPKERELLNFLLRRVQNQNVNIIFIENIKLNEIVSKDIFYFAKSIYYINNNNIRESITNFLKAYPLSNYSKFFIIEIMKQLLQQNIQTETAVNFLQEIEKVNVFENKSLINNLKGNLYFYNEQYLRAYQHYKFALDYDNNKETLQNLILSLYKLNRFDYALYKLNNSDLDKKFYHFMMTLIYQHKELYSLGYEELQLFIEY